MIDADKYEYLCDRMPNDFRITALMDFDLDNETVSVCDSSDNAWPQATYNIPTEGWYGQDHDVVAVFNG